MDRQKPLRHIFYQVTTVSPNVPTKYSDLPRHEKAVTGHEKYCKPDLVKPSMTFLTAPRRVRILMRRI